MWGKCSNLVSSPQYNQLYKGKWCLPTCSSPLLEAVLISLLITGFLFFWLHRISFLNLQLTLKSSLLSLCITNVQSILGMNQQDVHLKLTKDNSFLVEFPGPRGPAATKDLPRIKFRISRASNAILLLSLYSPVLLKSCSELWDSMKNSCLSLFSVLTISHLEAPLNPDRAHTGRARMLGH